MRRVSLTLRYENFNREGHEEREEEKGSVGLDILNSGGQNLTSRTSRLTLVIVVVLFSINFSHIQS